MGVEETKVGNFLLTPKDTLPIMARSLRLDPAVVASPAITTIVDLSGSFIYFAIAKVLFFP